MYSCIHVYIYSSNARLGWVGYFFAGLIHAVRGRSWGGLFFCWAGLNVLEEGMYLKKQITEIMRMFSKSTIIIHHKMLKIVANSLAN